MIALETEESFFDPLQIPVFKSKKKPQQRKNSEKRNHGERGEENSFRNRRSISKHHLEDLGRDAIKERGS